jgi:lipopolysaccharide export system protein LptC
MRMTYKNVALGLALAVAIVSAAWVTLSYRNQSALMTQATALPDAYMEDVVAIIMNKQGKINMKIVTPKIIHYSENDLAQFTTPELTIYRKSPQPWYVTSEHAKTVNGTDKIDFWENVVIHHSADSNNPATLIKTTSLVVHPTSQTAETIDPISLIQPNLIVNGIGMFADMSTGYVKLLSKARGEYVPG